MNNPLLTHWDSIFIEGLRVGAIIGVHAWEKCQPQPLVFDLELFGQTQHAAISDNLADTVDYKKVSEDVIRLTIESRLDLIESLAEQICSHILQHYPQVTALTLKLSKPHAVKEAQQVGVKIFRQRA